MAVLPEPPTGANAHNSGQQRTRMRLHVLTHLRISARAPMNAVCAAVGAVRHVARGAAEVAAKGVAPAGLLRNCRVRGRVDEQVVQDPSRDHGVHRLTRVAEPVPVGREEVRRGSVILQTKDKECTRFKWISVAHCQKLRQVHHNPTRTTAPAAN